MLRRLGSLTEGLTLRGRCFLAAGAAAGASALVLGERDLLRVAVLLLALPLLSLAVVTRTRYRLSCTRRMQPERVVAGEASAVLLRLDNVSRLPTGLLLMEDSLPYALGGRPRFVLDRVEPRGVREVSYPVRSDVRGRFPVGPLQVRLTDPFGLVELPRSFTATTHLVVTPALVALPPVQISGSWSGGGESLSRSLASHGEDDAATREYRTGDDLRRVHWRSTAHRGEIMVRREEQPWQNRAAVLLDTRSVAHRGHGPGSSFEWMVSAAASVGTHLSQAGFQVRLVDDVASHATTGADLRHGGKAVAQGMLLERLAVVAASENKHLDDGVVGLRGSEEGLVVALLGACDSRDLSLLGPLRSSRSACLAILIDTGQWGRGKHGLDSTESAASLRAAGWQVVVTGPTGLLPALWSQLVGGQGARGFTSAAGTGAR